MTPVVGSVVLTYEHFADGDGWGDPCDFHPLRDDSYPGATEICDARDNDGDAQLGVGEMVDDDLDLGLVCGDCDDLEPNANVCLCEVCGSGVDDDCDTLADGADPDRDRIVYVMTRDNMPEGDTGAGRWIRTGAVPADGGRIQLTSLAAVNAPDDTAARGELVPDSRETVGVPTRA